MNTDQETTLCQAIETGLSAQFHQLPELTSALCILGLDNAVIALKQNFGFAKNETVLSRPAIDGVVAHVVEVGMEHIGKMDGLTLKDYLAAVHKIRKSLILHSEFGPRAYYDFIKNYV